MLTSDEIKIYHSHIDDLRKKHKTYCDSINFGEKPKETSYSKSADLIEKLLEKLK